MSACMLAQADDARNPLHWVHDWFTRSDPTIFVAMISVTGVIGTALLLALSWQRIQDWRLEPARRQPMRLFRRLMHQLGLRWMDRWRLWAMAWKLELAHPAALLISDVLFDQCLERFRTQGRPNAHHLARIRAIRSQLFPDQPS